MLHSAKVPLWCNSCNILILKPDREGSNSAILKVVKGPLRDLNSSKSETARGRRAAVAQWQSIRLKRGVSEVRFLPAAHALFRFWKPVYSTAIMRLLSGVWFSARRLFVGRISRGQFLKAFAVWWALPFVAFIALGFFALVAIIALMAAQPILAWLVLLPAFVLLAAWSIVMHGTLVRRLHDAGLAGWPILIPFIGTLYLIAGFIMPSEKEPNRYGQSSRADRSIADIGLNREVGLDDRGETWIAGLFVAGFVLAIIVSVILIFGFDDSNNESLDTPSPGTKFMVESLPE